MEQKEMSKAYAVDFDGTLCENRWPEIGEPNQELIGYLVGRRQQGDKVILWTCRKVGADVYIDDRAWNPITGMQRSFQQESSSTGQAMRF